MNEQGRISSELSTSAPVEHVVQVGAVGRDAYIGVPAGRPPTPRQLPLSAPGFVDRSAPLAELDRYAAGAGSTNVLLWGTAGVGKTALAVHWAQRSADRFPDGHLYVDLRSETRNGARSAHSALGLLLAGMGAAPASIPRETGARAALYRSYLAAGRYLVLLDDVHSADQGQPLLAGSGTSAVILTSRRRLADFTARTGVHRITVDRLGPDQAVEMLHTIVGPERSGAAPEQLRRLAGLCATLPLALRLAGEWAASRPSSSLGDLMHALEGPQAPWEALALEHDEDPALLAAFSESYRGVPDDAAGLFRSLGLLPGRGFDTYLAAQAAGRSLEAVRGLLDILVAAGLVDRVGAERFEVHALLWAYAAETARRADLPEDLARIRERVFQAYEDRVRGVVRQVDAVFTVGDAAGLADERAGEARFASRASALHWWDSEQENLVALLRSSAEQGQPARVSALALLMRAVYAVRPDIEKWAVSAELGRDAVHGSGTRIEADHIENLGMVRAQQHRVAAAMELHQRALALRRETGDSHGEAKSLNAIGLVHLREEHAADAEQVFGTAVELFRACGDPAWEGVALGNRADARLDGGDGPGAEADTGAALPLLREAGHVSGVFSVLITLARIARARGRIDDGLETIGEARSVAGAEGLTTHLAFADAEAAEMLAGAGRLTEAVEAAEHAAQAYASLGDLVRAAAARSIAAQALADRGEAERSVQEAIRAVELLHSLGRRRDAAVQLVRSASALFSAGHGEEGGRLLGEARTAIQAVGEDAELAELLTEVDRRIEESR